MFPLPWSGPGTGVRKVGATPMGGVCVSETGYWEYSCTPTAGQEPRKKHFFLGVPRVLPTKARGTFGAVLISEDSMATTTRTMTAAATVNTTTGTTTTTTTTGTAAGTTAGTTTGTVATSAGKKFGELVKETALEVKNAGSTRLRGLDPEKIGEILDKAIKRLNQEEEETSFLPGDAMRICEEGMAAVRAVAPEKEGRQLKNAIEIGNRFAIRLGVGIEDAKAAAVGDRVGAVDSDRMLLFVEVVGRLMFEVRKARLAARADARKSGDISRVARHVGLRMEDLGLDRVIAAQNAILDHGITHEQMVAFVSAGKTASLFYFLEIRNGKQTGDLGLWCSIMEAMVEDPDYNAEVEAVENEADYYDADTVASRKRQREEERAEWRRIVDELEGKC